ncbi:MAG: CHAT domain-containing tetratricopeptide repeat protein, partial [Planctomycetota bacterium]
YSKAEQALVEQLAIRENYLGETHKLTLNTMQFLANTLQRQGRYATAEFLHRRCLEHMAHAYGGRHARTLTSAVNLGDLLVKQGRHAEARALLLDTYRHSAAVSGLRSSTTVAAGVNLLVATTAVGDLDAATALLDAIEETPQNSFLYPYVVEAGAQLLVARGELAHATDELSNLIATARSSTPSSITRSLDRAILWERQRDKQALGALAVATQQMQGQHGNRHPETIRARRAYGGSLFRHGRVPEAIAELERAAAAFEDARLLAQYDGLDRAHFDVGLSPLPLLAACLAASGDAVGAWEQLERGFARGLLDGLEQRSARPMTTEESEKQRTLHGTVQHLEAQLAQLVARGMHNSVRYYEIRRHLTRVQVRQLDFETEQRERYEFANGRCLDVAALQAGLPADAAYVAWLDLPEHGQHWAFALRRNVDPICVRLAPPQTETLEELRHALRQSPTDPRRTRAADIVRRDSNATARRTREVASLCAEAHEQRLTPLIKELQATPNAPAVRQLIVLPSTVMAEIPLAALTRKYRIRYAPSGTVHTTLSLNPPAPKDRMLLVGDPRSPAAVDGTNSGPLPLPGSRQEVEVIASLAQSAPKGATQCDQLLGVAATEAELCKLQRTNQLGGYQVLHFATHALTNNARPFRSCLILGDSKTGMRLPELLADFPLDGRLTAAQIRYGWRLDADLVTLSACATAGGQARGYEGVLGFSQALFLAGARGLLLSLWPIDDRATTLLMARFYHGFWHRQLSKTAALEEAQAWLRTLGAAQVRHIMEAPADRIGVAAQQTADAPPFAHPYYWAAFVLVGAD